MVERIADRLRGRAACGELGDLRLEPGAQIEHQRPALRLPRGTALFGAAGAYGGLDVVERGDAAQRLGRDRRRAGLGQVVEAPPHMAPAEDQRDGVLSATSELLVGRVAVALQDAAIAAQ